MSKPIDFINAAMCDRERLIADVKKIATDNHLMVSDVWDMLVEDSKTPAWMVIVAKQERTAARKKEQKDVQDFMSMLQNAVK
jgi:hypothetical protein